MSPRQQSMISSTNSFTKITLAGCCLLLCIAGCSTSGPATTVEKVQDSPVIAVMPIDNLSGIAAPLIGIRSEIVFHLEKSAVSVVPDDQIEGFIVRHRLRYTGGMDNETARLLKEEIGADAVLFTALEYYNGQPPPKIALSARLVTAGDRPRILWMDGVGAAGDDAPGFLELSLVEDPDILLRRAIFQLTTSLVGHLSGQHATAAETRRTFEPQIVFNSRLLLPNRTYSVVVLPFLNLSTRRHAGQMMTHHFTAALKGLANMQPVEPGQVRQTLLNFRIVMQDGLSLADATALFSRMNVDLILSGRVFDYEDYQGAGGPAKVCFSASLIEHQTRESAWAASSCRDGDDGVVVFDWGTIRTAHGLAAAMVNGAVATLER